VKLGDKVLHRVPLRPTVSPTTTTIRPATRGRGDGPISARGHSQ
jgi:hypothetical protein